MSDSLIQFPEMASGASFAGTCFMHTMMFKSALPYQHSQSRQFVILRPSGEDGRRISTIKCTQIAHYVDIHQRTAPPLRMTRDKLGSRVCLFPCPAPENQRGVGAAKSKGIRERVLDRSLASVIGHIVQIALRIWSFKIDGRRQSLIVQSQYADARFKDTRTTE